MIAAVHPPVPRRKKLTNLVGRLLRAALYCAGLVPLSIAALIAVLAGQSAAATAWFVRWQRHVAVASVGTRRGASAWAAAGNSLSGLVLGVLAVVPLGVEALLVARGLLYGVVDQGPYDTSWGGPTRIGAWTVHFLVALPFAVAALFVLRGIAVLHVRWGRLLDGAAGGWWVPVVTGLACLADMLLIRAWLAQI